MSSKSFRGIHGVKLKSSSSPFISLHFNKADEEQIEISYSDDKKYKEVSSTDVPETFQSTSLCSNQNTDSKSKSIQNNDLVNKVDKSSCSCETPSNLNFVEGFEDEIKGISKSADDIKIVDSPLVSTDGDSKYSQKTECIKHFDSNEVQLNAAAIEIIHDASKNLLKLSPAIEASELGVENIFDNYINDELEKAKCEIFDPRKQVTSSVISSKLLLPHKSAQSSSEINLELTEDCYLKSKTCVDCEDQLRQSTVRSALPGIIKRFSDYTNFARNSVKFHILIVIFACVFAPVPSWLSGFVIGIILSSSSFYWLYKPQKNAKSYLNYNFVETQAGQVSEVKNDSGIFKGWMNELPPYMSYDPEKYHVCYTRSLYVRLDSSYLRFSFPLKNIPKRAMFNEPRQELQFIHQQHYDITGATIELLPKGLASRRLWSKKYPICLRIPNSKDSVLSNPSKKDAASGSFSSKVALKKESTSKKFTPRINESNEVVIYLFSRTDRDKNLWYHRFSKASMMKIPSPVSLSTNESDITLENKRALSVDFASLQFSSSNPNKESIFYEEKEEVDSFVELSLSKQQKFELYMSNLLAPLYEENPYSFSLYKKDKVTSDKKPFKVSNSQGNLMWLNALMGRIFFDFLIEDIWAQLVREKIQKKLNKLKLPFFLNELTVKDMNLGSALPKIHRASDPFSDERGLWIDIDLSYNGSCHMTLETKLNLLKLKGDSDEFWSSLPEQDEMKSPVYNSEEEDSAESSSDEDMSLPHVNAVNSHEESSAAGSTSKRILKFVDKLAQSSYFQHATKNKYIKKAMEDISNTPLLLTVQVQWLTGTLALNIPSWPADRLWYGFRTNPSLSITARPMLGQKVVTLTHVTEWIEKKLLSEFQKVLVMPNMDDLIIPIMQPYLDSLEV